MIKEQRYDVIKEFLKGKGIVLVEKISIELTIPLTTLRRDLNGMDKLGIINKHHGGVELVESFIIPEEFFDHKVAINIKEKLEIAKKAISKIKRNESIFIDAGSNGYYIAKLLKPNLELTIVTNSIYNIQELSKNGHKNIYLLGGKFKVVTGAIVGYEAIEALKNYNFDKAFIGVNAVDKNNDIYTTSSEHAQIKIEIIKHSQKAYGLADSSKLNSKSFYKFANTRELELIS
ncbi:DeoR family transcriptional regulator [Spiroplasma sp. TIUS-1]|uniref:DeoR/GlpR family DNA-binding transcription regulator n=1 Tax=Spiroplasma sp. TIUS-1 TaxID=216963 RepID=UPI001398E09F|nr:DeoR/GlpR family DNA-binding transcription regulator [Spiroplasma sp. TIUS-1]QHX35947.1 DeoR family transcriptional regulator [Spiroplasma sp. TIUS-1]